MGYFDDPARDKTPLIIGGGVVLLLALSWFICGFFGAREARVTGTVVMDEKPVAGAHVVLLGQDEGNNRAPFLTTTNDDGRFEVIGTTGKGIPRGKYKVAVSKMVAANGSTPAKGEDGALAGQSEPPVNTLPQVYESAETTPLVFQIGGGSNTIKVELKKGS